MTNIKGQYFDIMTKCNNCEDVVREEDLEMLTEGEGDDIEHYKGCGKCNTDSYLKDVNITVWCNICDDESSQIEYSSEALDTLKEELSKGKKYICSMCQNNLEEDKDERRLNEYKESNLIKCNEIGKVIGNNEPNVS